MRLIEIWVLNYLLNAAWQAMVVFAAAWLIARAVRRLGPRIEHRIWVAALIMQVTLPLVHLAPFTVLWGSLHSDSPGLITVTAGPATTATAMQASAGLVTAVMLLYASALLVSAIRLVVGVWRTHQLGTQSEPAELPEAAACLWQQVLTQAGVAAELRLSTAVRGPVTIGIRRKLLLLPPGCAEASTATELHAALAHECAHMRREDFTKNLLYEVLRLPLAWHPAVWLSRARLTESREMVCDATAAEAVAGRRDYARALLHLASEMAQVQREVYAIGIFNANRPGAGELERRIMRLSERAIQVKGTRRFVLLSVCVVAAFATCAAAAALRVSVAAPAGPQEETTATGKGVPISPGVMAGQLESHVNPKYPPIAKAAHVSGSVVLQAVIGKDGAMKSLHVLSGPDMLRGSALDAVRQWKYRPYLLNGEPTEVETTITVNYTLPPAPPPPPPPPPPAN